jgi:uncharacterized protein YqjF (DUF2071 family)
VTTLGFLSHATRQAASTEHSEHRPWPLPESPWVMGQTWDDLLFAHWRLPPDQVRGHVPQGLELDTREGEAWIGITPFRVVGLRARGTLPLPRVSSFLELNCRTYVTRDGKPGIWFFSLDASSELAVLAARRLYRLPYFRARIELERLHDRIQFECARVDEPGKVWSGAYRGHGDFVHADRGTLEHFLTERYCLYAEDGGRLFRAEIHHAPWPLQPAEAEIELNTIAPLELPAEDPVLHYSHRQDVVIRPLEQVG